MFIEKCEFLSIEEIWSTCEQQVINLFSGSITTLFWVAMSSNSHDELFDIVSQAYETLMLVKFLELVFAGD